MASDLKHGTLAGGGTVAIAGEVEVKNDAGSPIPVSGPLTDAQLRAATVPVSGTLAVTESGTWTVVLDATSLAALETINAAQSGVWTVALDAASLAALESITVVDGGGSITVDGTVAVSNPGLTDTQLRAAPVPISGTVTVNVGLTDAQLRATPVPVSGTLALDAGTLAALESITVVDGGGSITVDGVFWQATQPVSLASVPTHGVTGPLTDTELRASAVPVTYAALLTELQAKADLAETQPVSIAAVVHAIIDSSASIAVTGPLTDAQLRASAVPVDTELPAAAALNDNVANPTVPGVGAFEMVWDGATWDRETQPLTDTQIRATALPVSGPLTDAQLRATAVPISGTLSVSQDPEVKTNRQLLEIIADRLLTLNYNTMEIATALGGHPVNLEMLGDADL